MAFPRGQLNITYIIILHLTPSRKRDYGCCFLYCHPLHPSNKTTMKHFAGVSCGGCLLLLLSALCLLTRSSTGAAAMVVAVPSIHERRSTETVIDGESLSFEDSDRQLEDGQITVMPTGTMGPTGASTQSLGKLRTVTHTEKVPECSRRMDQCLVSSLNLMKKQQCLLLNMKMEKEKTFF